MNPIIEKTFQETVDYSNRTLEYFIQEENKSALEDYRTIIDTIKNARKLIKIASTSNIADEIIDALFSNSSVNTYLIFSSFEQATNTLARFDQRKPVLMREIQELENSFIIIDDVAYLFINPLSEEKNICLTVSETETKDLDFLFSYYFWNCASKERIVNTITNPIESPFPPFPIRKLNHINITKLESFQNIFIPKDRSFVQYLDNNAENYFLSNDLKVPLFINQNYLQLGKFVLDKKIDIRNRWIFKKEIQKNINSDIEIIHKMSDWNRAIKIIDLKDVALSNIRAESIEQMDITRPESFPKEDYINTVRYSWRVLPPVRPKNAEQSNLYSEFDELKERLIKDLNKLEPYLESIIKESGDFSGANRKATQNLKKIKEYRERNIHLMSTLDLDDFLNSEFREFYQFIIKDENDFKEEKERKKAENMWNTDKKKKEKELEKTLDEIRKNNEELKALENKCTNIDDQSKRQKELEKNISQLKKVKETLDKELETYLKFDYQPKINELSHLNSSSSENFRHFSVPKFALPEVGTLFENRQSYFLEISYYEELEKANELEKRYLDKSYKVVVKDSSE